MTLTTAWAIFALAALATATGLWAAHLSVSTTTRGAAWAVERLPGASRWSFVAMGVGALAVVLIDPVWLGLGVVYLGAVVAWTARSALKGLRRLHDAGVFEPLPAERQSAVVRRVSTWLLVTAALGIGITAIDVEARGGAAWFDLLLVGVVAGAGLRYRRRASDLDPGSGPLPAIDGEPGTAIAEWENNA